MRSFIAPLLALVLLAAPPVFAGKGDKGMGTSHGHVEDDDAYLGGVEDHLRRGNRRIEKTAGLFKGMGKWLRKLFGVEKKKKYVDQARNASSALRAALDSGDRNVIDAAYHNFRAAVKKLGRIRSRRGLGGRISKKDWALMGKALGDALAANPENAGLLEFAAQDGLQTGDYAGTVSHASKALAIEASANLYAMRGAAYNQLKDYPAAVNDARAALKMNPNHKGAFETLKFSEGRGGYAAGSAGGAGGAFRAPLGGAYGGGSSRGEEALRFGGVSANAGLSADFANKALHALRRGDLDAAIRFASRALDLDANNARAYRLRALAYRHKLLFGMAVKDSMKGLALAPKDLALLNTNAFALNKIGEHEKALTAANAALAIDPHNADALANKAYAVGALGNRAEMIRLLKRAAAIDSKFKPSLESALQMPADSDLLFLFPGETLPKKSPAEIPADAPKKPFSILIISTVVGGFLLAVGLLSVFTGVGSRLKDTLSRLTGSKRISPAVSAYSGSNGSVATPVPGEGPALLNDQFEIVRKIGEGGMGVVYEGRDRKLGRRVAIKRMRAQIRDNERERERFLEEARTVAALHHPNLVEIYSIVEEAKELYLVFEHVEGPTLFEIITRQGPQTAAYTANIFKGIAAALDYAHAHKVIHRDLKPSNIMVAKDDVAKVMDFGVARVAKDVMTKMTNTVLGTPPYMAPEQEQGVVSRDADIYAMAICLYETLSGRLPFVGSGSGMLMNKINMNYAPVSTVTRGLPAGIDDLFKKAFSNNTGARFHTGAELVAALEALLAAPPSTPKA